MDWKETARIAGFLVAIIGSWYIAVQATLVVWDWIDPTL